MRLKLISCEVLFREMCYLVSKCVHQVDIEFMPKGLHDLGGAAMCRRLQERVDAVDPAMYDVILFGYALCGNGVVGLEAKTIPIVLPRAHDCIALLMGSRERYQAYFDANPGVYFRSPGWLERGENLEQLTLEESRKRSGVGYTREELIARYGEENGEFLWEQFTAYSHTYRQITYIEMGVEPDNRFEEQAKKEAERRGWAFDRMRGDLTFVERLLSGDWDDKDFLKVPPGWRIAPRYDGAVIGIERTPS